MLSEEFHGAFVWDIHLLPLPYHRAAFPLSIAMRSLRSLAERKGYRPNLYAMQFLDVILRKDFQEIISDLSGATEVNNKNIELPDNCNIPTMFAPCREQSVTILLNFSILVR